MVSKIQSSALIGIEASSVLVETSISQGLPSFTIVGLGDIAIQEAKERVRAAIKNSGFTFPPNRLTVNLAPADVKKEGSAYDLPIALGILSSFKKIKINSEEKLFIGELALDGTLRPVSGILATALFAKKNNIKEVFLPESNQKEASLVKGLKIFPVNSLKELFEHFEGKKRLKSFLSEGLLKIPLESDFEIDFGFIKGQECAKRALEIAAAGGHNVLLNGPPGTGKTLLAKALPSILPKMTPQEILEVTKIYSIAGLLPKEKPIIVKRPFRAPHHSASLVSLTGGGQVPRPGEVSLAHRGVLFLDEMPEFPRDILESLRQPLEDGKITVSRAQASFTFPASFTLIASKNPCPCGFLNDPEKECTCSLNQIQRYHKKISGPLLDRIDLHLEVPRIKATKLTSDVAAESSAEIQKRVQKARQIQLERFKNEKNVLLNTEMDIKLLKKYCGLSEKSKRILSSAIDRLRLSPRAYTKVIKVARTIADLNNEEKIKTAPIAEALQYRQGENIS